MQIPMSEDPLFCNNSDLTKKIWTKFIKKFCSRRLLTYCMSTKEVPFVYSPSNSLKTDCIVYMLIKQGLKATCVTSSVANLG